MKRFQKINLVIFLSVVATTCVLIYITRLVAQPSVDGKPWHLQPFVHEDSLSNEYKAQYKVLGKQRIGLHMKTETGGRIFILVDAWGVPIEENELAKDFSAFAGVPCIFAIHQRLANYSKHAERAEFRNDVPENIYLFGGDSMEYNRPEYIKEMGFSERLFCQHCSDSVMIEKIDSILALDAFKYIAWTTQSSRSGDRDSLRNSLRLIANFAKRHPETVIVVQGTHRPVLGTPEVRKSYKSHWVPAAFLNVNE